MTVSELNMEFDTVILFYWGEEGTLSPVVFGNPVPKDSGWGYFCTFTLARPSVST